VEEEVSLFGLVCTKKYEETESCGSAADFYQAWQLMPVLEYLVMIWQEYEVGLQWQYHLDLQW
jgi:ATP adenylyltransferase/5',5'''-P-1,P-4-tetraphosphate phosphorylase II